jgi:hypothetical protein
MVLILQHPGVNNPREVTDVRRPMAFAGLHEPAMRPSHSRGPAAGGRDGCPHRARPDVERMEIST